MVLAVSVDLDAISLYRSLHGLKSLPDEQLIYGRALPRLADWARQRGLLLTWFVVGQDLQHPANAEAIARVASHGDELGCHTYSHPYDLTQRAFSEIRLEVEQGVAALTRAAGVKVSGFRAPGYVVSDPLLDLLREAGFAYDSSVFPCPAYYALKLGALAAIRLRGQSSAAVVSAPEVVRAPSEPYRVGKPYWFRGTGIWEIPIQVTRRSRMPFIGTSLTMGGATGARLLASRIANEPFINLELHGIDALDEHDGLADLAKHQRDLRIPWSKKLEAIDAAVTLLQQRGHAGVRLDELAAKAASA